MTTVEELAEELNLVAEYAGTDLEFEVKEGPKPGQGLVCLNLGKTEVLVELGWAMGNIKRLPDHASERQIIDAIHLSHPDVKGVSEKHPERRSS